MEYMNEKIPENFPYCDILYHKRHVSPTRRSMDVLKRAAQFMPFDALTGFDEAMEEVERFKQSAYILGDDEKYELECKLNFLLEHGFPRQELLLTFGTRISANEVNYATQKVIIKYIVPHERRIVLLDGRSINFDMLISLEGAIFEHMDDYS